MSAKRAVLLLGCAVGCCGCYFPRGRSHVAFDRMTLNGVSSQQTLWELYFEPESVELSPLGQDRLAWIVTHLDRRDPRIYVQAVPGKDEQTEGRIEVVSRELRRYKAAPLVVAVLPTWRRPQKLFAGYVISSVVTAVQQQAGGTEGGEGGEEGTPAVPTGGDEGGGGGQDVPQGE